MKWLLNKITISVILFLGLSHPSFSIQFTEGVSKTTPVQTGTFNVSFPFKNDQNSIAIIFSVSASYGRCHGSFSKEPLRPQKTSAINFTCSNLDKGYFNKSLTVNSNQGTFNLRVSGHFDPSPEDDETCTNVRLDESGGSMEHVNVRDQKGAGACYAYAVSQVYDAWRFQHGDKNYQTQTSAIEAAYAYAIQLSENQFGGQLNGEAKMLEFLQKRGGTCPNSYIEKNFPGVSDPGFIGSMDDIFSRFDKVKNKKLSQLKELKANPKEAAPDLVLTPMQKKLLRELGDSQFSTMEAIKEETQEIRSCLQAYDVSPIKEIEASIGPLLKDKNLIKFLALQGNPNCPSAEKLKASFNTDTNFWFPFSAMKKNLKNKYSMPVLLDICSKVLDDGKSFNQKCTANHAVLSIGRRRNPRTQKCEYLIRNSWGGICSYSKDWDCQPNGDVWVEAGALSNATFGATVAH